MSGGEEGETTGPVPGFLYPMPSDYATERGIDVMRTLTRAERPPGAGQISVFPPSKGG